MHHLTSGGPIKGLDVHYTLLRRVSMQPLGLKYAEAEHRLKYVRFSVYDGSNHGEESVHRDMVAQSCAAFRALDRAK